MRISRKIILASILALAAAPLAASQEMPMNEGAPPASEDALYCLRVEAALGTRLETVQCHTRAEWADMEVDVDADWAEEGVRVIDNQAA